MINAKDIANKLNQLLYIDIEKQLTSLIGEAAKKEFDQSYLYVGVKLNVHQATPARIVDAAKESVKFPTGKPFTAAEVRQRQIEIKACNDAIIKNVKYKIMYEQLHSLSKLIMNHLRSDKQEWNDKSLSALNDFYNAAKEQLGQISSINDAAEKNQAMSHFVEWSWQKCSSICPPSLDLEYARSRLVDRDDEIFNLLKSRHIVVDTPASANNVSREAATVQHIKSKEVVQPPVRELTDLTNMMTRLNDSNRNEPQTPLQLAIKAHLKNALDDEVMVKNVADLIKEIITQQPNLMVEKSDEVVQLYEELIKHIESQKSALENVIENIRKDMNTKKASPNLNDRNIKDMQFLQMKVNHLNLDLHKAEVNKIKYSDPSSLSDTYSLQLLTKSSDLFEELINIRSMPTDKDNENQIKAQQDKFQQFVEKLSQHKEMVNTFVDNAVNAITGIAEKAKFRTSDAVPLSLADLEKEKKVLEVRIRANSKMLDEGKNLVTKVSSRLSP